MARFFKEMRFETMPDMEVFGQAATVVNTIVIITKHIYCSKFLAFKKRSKRVMRALLKN